MILSYEVHSFFKYLILKLAKLRQPDKKYIQTTIFWTSFPLPPLSNVDVCKLHRDYAAKKLLTHNIDIGEEEVVLMELSLSFLRENPNKLCFVELSQNFCD